MINKFEQMLSEATDDHFVKD